MLKNFFLLSQLSIFSLNVQAACPAGDEGFQSGCLNVEENHFNANSNKVQIFFQWYQTKNPKKPTIVMLNGGPGGSLLGYKTILENSFLPFAENYNVLLYDQRGVGRSGQINADNIVNRNMELYSTDQGVEDLAKLIDDQTDGKAIILGHSYGASLAYAFAVKYPEKVEKLMVLNGSADATGFIAQTYKKQQLTNQALAGLDQKVLTALVTLITQGKALDQNGQTISMNQFQMAINMNLSTYIGQTVRIRKIIEDFISINQVAIEEILNSSVVANENIVASLLHEEGDVKEEFNFYVNQHIVCREMINEKVFASQPFSQQYIEMSKLFVNGICAPLNLAASDLKVFDAASQFARLQMPVLIVGGTHDPLVPLEAQQKDYNKLSQTNNKVMFVTFEKTGHQVFVESKTCTNDTITDFLNTDYFVESESKNCIEP